MKMIALQTVNISVRGMQILAKEGQEYDIPPEHMKQIPEGYFTPVEIEKPIEVKTVEYVKKSKKIKEESGHANME